MFDEFQEPKMKYGLNEDNNEEEKEIHKSITGKDFDKINYSLRKTENSP